jgi:hypothetical protein
VGADSAGGEAGIAVPVAFCFTLAQALSNPELG